MMYRNIVIHESVIYVSVLGIGVVGEPVEVVGEPVEIEGLVLAATRSKGVISVIGEYWSISYLLYYSILYFQRRKDAKVQRYKGTKML